MTTLEVERLTADVLVISEHLPPECMPVSFPVRAAHGPLAVVVHATGDDCHRERWPVEPLPVLVVLPAGSPSSAVVAAFAAGADACVCTASGAEVTAHLGALLRRRYRT